jgi:hypothetical protein
MVLDAHPEAWSSYGDLARRAKAAWLDLIAGEDLLLRESVSRHLEALPRGVKHGVPKGPPAVVVKAIIGGGESNGHVGSASGDSSIPSVGWVGSC